jgi:hypothetical protein
LTWRAKLPWPESKSCIQTLFDDRFMFEMKVEGCEKSCKPVVKLDRTIDWWRGTARPNGYARVGGGDGGSSRARRRSSMVY